MDSFGMVKWMHLFPAILWAVTGESSLPPLLTAKYLKDPSGRS